MSTDRGFTWVDVTTDLVQIPTNTIELIDTDVYAGLSGFGIFKSSLNDLITTPNWDEYLPRYTNRKGINFGTWNVKSIEEDNINPNRIFYSFNFNFKPTPGFIILYFT